MDIIVVILIILIICYVINKYRVLLNIYYNDILYYYRILNTNIVRNNNLITKPINKKNKILIITFDNRPTLEYVIEHNKNLSQYSQKWKYEYIFYDKCSYNIYWCKIYMVLDALESNKYDYVMWMDSDTIIKNMNTSLDSIVNNYSSDIFVGTDLNYPIINAGVFIIKNTLIGKNFLKDCIAYLNPTCVNADKTLNGLWALTCYEQGNMNILIKLKYSQHTTILPTNLIYNHDECNENVFIMHLCASTVENRINCFNKNQNIIRIQ
ncbi:MAG: putative glycosyltransferase [Edafosvirus sp.]|uniref:Putative glycosyltransferase n=1 Tax=Edafosvirus sp. TaxID=2487765 RepID=A0A3G4ZVF9_9VIRU|nr:MAG: putative glycosyltransferase [Edafosvirus sp.]